MANNEFARITNHEKILLKMKFHHYEHCVAQHLDFKKLLNIL